MSDTPLHHFCNREICEKLCELQDRNVLLLLIDGSAIFGRIGRIDDLVLSVVPPIGITALTFVQLRPPNSNLTTPILVSQIFIDICDIAHIAEGPFTTAPLIFPTTATTTITTEDSTTTTARTALAGSIVDRQQWCLIEELRRLEGQNSAIGTLGGWVIGGQLGEIHRDCLGLISTGTALFPPLIIAATITIFGPAFPRGVLPLVGPFRVWSNLKALTQMILP